MARLSKRSRSLSPSKANQPQPESPGPAVVPSQARRTSPRKKSAARVALLLGHPDVADEEQGIRMSSNPFKGHDGRTLPDLDNDCNDDDEEEEDEDEPEGGNNCAAEDEEPATSNTSPAEKLTILTNSPALHALKRKELTRLCRLFGLGMGGKVSVQTMRFVIVERCSLEKINKPCNSGMLFPLAMK